MCVAFTTNIWHAAVTAPKTCQFNANIYRVQSKSRFHIHLKQKIVFESGIQN